MSLIKFAKLSGVALALCCLFLSPSVYAQSESSVDVIVIEMPEIDAYSYGDIARAMKNHDQVSINEACVPGKLVVFNVNDASLSQEAAFAIIKQLIINSSSITEVELTGLSKSEFSTTCLNVRRGITGQ